MSRSPAATLVFLLFAWIAELSAQGSYEKHFHSFVFAMDSEITMVDEDSEMRAGVRLHDVLLTYDKEEDAYLGEGDLEHVKFELSLGSDCSIVEPLYRSDRFFVRVEVDEFHDAAPEVRLFLRMRGTDEYTMAGEGAVIECVTGSGGTQRFTFQPVPYWVAGWFVIRNDLGELPTEPHGWPIKDIQVDGWSVTGIEDESFRVHKELTHSAIDTSGAVITEVARYELTPCIEYAVEFTMGMDSYTFANAAESVWPESYWSAFRYDLEDEIFRTLTGNPAPSRYPDWYSMERAFGEAQVLRSSVPRVFNPSALIRWKQWSRDFFPGACYGFTYSALLHYCNLRGDVPQPLGALGPDDMARDELIEKFCYQMSRESVLEDMRQRNTTPRQLIEKLVENFRDDGQRNRGLAIFAGGQGHSMVPLRVRRCVDKDTREIVTEIDVWDNFEPAVHRTLTVNETLNRVIGSQSELARGVYPDAPADIFAGPYPTLAKSGATMQPSREPMQPSREPMPSSRGLRFPVLAAGEWTEVYHQGGGMAALTVEDRQAVDLHAADLEPAPDLFPVHVKTGTVPIVPGYYVADTLAGELRCEIQSAGGRDLLSAIDASGLVDLGFAAEAGTTLQAWTSLARPHLALSSSAPIREAELLLVRNGTHADLAVRLDALEFTQADSMVVNMGNGDPVVSIMNSGGEKHLGLEVLSFGVTFARSGRVPVTLPARAAVHLAVGSPDSLRTTRIAVRIDHDADGTVDEEHVLRDYGVAGLREPAPVAADVHAWPAPWNGMQPLRLRYALRESAVARVVIQDLLQRTVAEPVPSRYHEAEARYDAHWDGRDHAGQPLPSGLYFHVVEISDGRRVAGAITLLR